MDRRAFVFTGIVGSVAALLGWRHVTYRFPGERVRRGESDPIERRERVESGDVTYVGDDVVEIVLARRGDEPVRTRTIRFDEWASATAEQEAVRAISAHLLDEIETDEELPGLERNDVDGTLQSRSGRPIDAQLEDGVLIEYVHRVVDGELRDKPPVDYDLVVELSPRSVTMTVSLSGHTHTSRIPVWVQRVKGGISQPG